MNEAVSKKEQELAAKQQELEKELEAIRASLAAAQSERDEAVSSIDSKEAQWKKVDHLFPSLDIVIEIV